MILTDELIEKAARAFCIDYEGIDDTDQKLHPDYDWQIWTGEVRAAITAILPDILEAAANAAENYLDSIDEPEASPGTADAIRSLIHNP